MPTTADTSREPVSATSRGRIKAFLVGGGIAASRVTARSYGESRPIASNDSDEGRALNRRVELHTD